MMFCDVQISLQVIQKESYEFLKLKKWKDYKFSFSRLSLSDL